MESGKIHTGIDYRGSVDKFGVGDSRAFEILKTGGTDENLLIPTAFARTRCPDLFSGDNKKGYLQTEASSRRRL